MTIDTAKLRAEVLALIDGTTPGPWWTDGEYDAGEMGCAIIAARTDAGPLPGNPTRGMVAFSSAIIHTQARGCEANARLIAATPTLAADTLRLLDEIEARDAENERLRAALAPFADFADLLDSETEGLGDYDEFDVMLGRHLFIQFSVRQFNAARAALTEGDPA